MATEIAATTRRQGAPVQLEDLALFALLAGVEPLLERRIGRGPALFGPWSDGSGATGGTLQGLALLAAALGAVTCLVTRPRGRPARDVSEVLGSLEGWSRFPLMVFVAAVLEAGLAPFGVRLGEGFFFATVIVLSVPLAVYPRLPEVAVPLRRALATPIVLVGASSFRALVEDFVGDGDRLPALPARDDPTFGFAVFVLSLLAAATGAFYVMLVVAPRSVAGAGGGTLWWVLRFGVFLVGLGFGVTLPL